MSEEVTCHTQMTIGEKKRLFWASFIALAAAAYGFVFRVLDLMGGALGKDLEFTQQQFGELFGASLWPIAVTMIIFSMAVDKIGYKPSMIMAFAFQVASVLISFISTDYNTLYWAAVCGGLGHGIIEAVINPLCATIYRDQKSKMLNILHAAWPAGIVAGGTIIMLTGTASWQLHFGIMLIPVVIYGIMFLGCKFPVDERVKARVSYREMLGEFGGAGFFIAATLIIYEMTRIVNGLAGGDPIDATQLLLTSAGAGAVLAFAFGMWVKSPGRILFFLMCLLMIPLATTELGTDSWIQALMKPVLGANAGWSIVVSAGIMMTLRFNAGLLLKKFSPPAVLLISCCFSASGLVMLSKVDGSLVFLAFVFYAIGQTFLWPTVLGFVSERFPKGGAVTLNSVAAVGLLALGIVGNPFLGVIQDSSKTQELKAVYGDQYVAGEDGSFFGAKFERADDAAIKSALPVFVQEAALTEAENEAELATLRESEAYTTEIAKFDSAVATSKRSALAAAAVMPLFMAVCFLAITLHFKSKGGYKPVMLDISDEPAEA